MSVLLVNGINLGAIVALFGDPKGDRRDIGDSGEASDGTFRITRQTRKRDFNFKTIPLSDSDAYSWESLLTGEGEAWSFDVSLYGSKGLGPSSSSGASLVSSTPKFGAQNLRLAATTGTITYAAAVNSVGTTSAWTVCVWRYESGAWHHYIVRSDGSKWYDGVQNNALSTTWLSVSSGNVTIANTTGATVDYDDLVVLPFKIIDSWAASIGTASSAFAPLPFLDVSGDLVPESSSRRVLATVKESLTKTGAGVRHSLEVELKAK